jgi:predicted enzyme related to lactoylglutathione lyase
MITRLDHVMIAVRDLDSAIDHYQRLGFAVTAGRTHETLGIHNAIIQLGPTYIELISTFNPVLTMSVIPGIEIVLNILDQRDGAMVGFALTSTNMQEDIEHLAGTDLVVTPPYMLNSELESGEPLNIQVFMPEGFPWRRPWPFLYQWETPDAQSQATNIQHTHSNGSTEIVRVSVGVNDFAGTIDLYQHKLGLKLQQQDTLARLEAHRATFRVGNSSIDLITPHKKGILQKELVELGDGIFEVFFAVNNLKQSRKFFKEQGIEYIMDAGGPGTLMIAPHETFGTRCIFTQQKNA